MPRSARLDAPGALHHVIARGIEQKKIEERPLLKLLIDISTIIWYLCFMRISTEKLKSLCKEKKQNLKLVLHNAGVSRNAYYSLARKKSVLPKSIIAIAHQLDVQPSVFLEEESRLQQRAQLLLVTLDKIMKRHKKADRDTVRHTLLLLQEKPVNRLRRALLRAEKFDFR